MTLNPSPSLRIQSHLHRPFYLYDALRQMHRYSPRPTNRRHHLHPLSIPLNPTRVPHLSPHLPVKRCLPQEYPSPRTSRPHLFQLLRRHFLDLQLLRLLIPGKNRWKIRSRLILHLDRRLILRLPCPRTLSLHRLFKSSPIHLHSPFPRQQLGQIQRKPIRVI